MSPPGNGGTGRQALICSCRGGEALSPAESGGRGVRGRVTQLQAGEKAASVIGPHI